MRRAVPTAARGFGSEAGSVQRRAAFSQVSGGILSGIQGSEQPLQKLPEGTE